MARALMAVTLIMVVTQYVRRGKQKKMAGASKQLSLCTESSNGRNVAHLLYGFDTENPWKHFTGGQAPLLKQALPALTEKALASVTPNFENFLIEDLSDIISFGKARVDTCQLCDQYQKKMRQEALDSRLQEYAVQQQRHLLESEVRFASLKYDVFILAKTRNRDEAD